MKSRAEDSLMKPWQKLLKVNNRFWRGNNSRKKKRCRCSSGKAKMGEELEVETEEVCSNTRWSDLHESLLELILKHTPIKDRGRFSSVCHAWRAAEMKNPVTPQLPWLMLHTDCKTETRLFFSLTEHRVRSINLSGAFGKWCLGSYGGWILMEDIFSADRVLINLISKEQFTLPPNKRYYFDCFLVLAPNDPELVVLLCGSKSSAQIFQPGSDWKWTKRQRRNLICFNVISCNGKLYGLNHRQALVAVDFSHNPQESLIELDVSQLPHSQYYNSILVESCQEVLLVTVIKHRNRDYSFRVYRVDMEAMAWVKVDNLGDQILFLAPGSSVSVSGADVGDRGNRVYYIPMEAIRKGYWIEFDLETGKSEEHSIPGSGYGIERTWVTPNLQQLATC
ncbi:hypothetical protein ACLOJK_015946 [Asimina triloba]